MISATKKWIFLKVSSVVLVPLMLWFLFNLVSLFVIFAYFYSALSISEVFEDYIENEKLKNVANKLLYLSAIVIPISTLFILFRLSL